MQQLTKREKLERKIDYYCCEVAAGVTFLFSLWSAVEGEWLTSAVILAGAFFLALLPFISQWLVDFLDEKYLQHCQENCKEMEKLQKKIEE